VLAHLTGTVDEIVHSHRVGRLLEFVHNIRVYPRPARPCPELVPGKVLTPAVLAGWLVA
jgi:hypothetical protein